MSMSIQQASALVGQSLGFDPSFDGSITAINALDTNSQLALTAGLNAYILANPTNFTAGQVATANAFKGLSGQPLADSGFSYTDFFSAATQNGVDLVVKPLENVGQAASAVTNALPLILIIVGAVLLIAFTKGKAAELNPA